MKPEQEKRDDLKVLFREEIREPSEADMEWMRAFMRNAKRHNSQHSVEVYRTTFDLTKDEASVSSGHVVEVQPQQTPDNNGQVPSAFVLDVLMSAEDAKDVAANLEDMFPYWEQKHGIRKARFVFRVQMAHVVVGYWWNRVLSQAERVLNVVKGFNLLGGG